MPYVLASIFVQFLHAGPQVGAAAAAFSAGTVVHADSQGSKSDDSCPACLWLHASVPLGSPVLSHEPARVASSEIEPPGTAQPDSPAQHPTSPRGPPPSLLN
jgi:hypothetical protein